MFKLIQSPSKTELNHFQAGTQNSIHSLYCLKQGDLKWIQKNILNKLCPLYLALLCYLINQLTYQGFAEVDLGQSFLITFEIFVADRCVQNRFHNNGPNAKLF